MTGIYSEIMQELAEGGRNFVDGLLDGPAERLYTIFGNEKKAKKREKSYWHHDELDNMTAAYDVGRLVGVFFYLPFAAIASCRPGKPEIPEASAEESGLGP